MGTHPIFESDFDCLTEKMIAEKLTEFGMEAFSFNTDEYDSLVEKEFRLNRPDSRALLIISRPDFFEKCVVPFIKENSNNLQDPIDASAKSQIEKLFQGKEIVFDYELHPNRRPKILMQTAMHVSGCAWFYQKQDCDLELLPSDLRDQKLLGVCLHPEFGGYFSARAVVFIDIPDIPVKKPVKILSEKREISKLLEEMNSNWRAGRWRDFGIPTKKYSSEALEFFNTKPKERNIIIERIRQSL